MTKVRPRIQLLILLLLLAFNLSAFSQKLVYEGFLRGNKVGELIAQREVNDENTKIHVTTDIEAHMLFTIEVDLESKSTYINQNLVESSSVSKVNGNVKSSVQTVHQEDHYQINIDGEEKIIEQAELTGADIFYFEEPAKLTEVYSLALGEIMEVEKGDEPNVYFFERDGKKEYHKYKDGILVEVQIDHALYSITFKIKE